MFEDLLRDWDGEFVATGFDPATGTWLFVGVHSTALGPGFGGTRMKVYPSAEDALRDVLRLSSAMTWKNALAGIDFGGGKSVLAVPAIPEGDVRRALLERYADLVGSLGGSYVTACDMNTTERDMDVVGERCSDVMGRSVAAGGSGTSAPDTALGVFHGIRAAVVHAFDDPDLTGRTIAIQGAGAVGAPLARLLAEAGASLVVADVDGERASSVATEVGAGMVGPDEIVGEPCDVFAPCATGGVLNLETIPRLRCAIVAGAANNQLAEPQDADRLADRGILYAPDFVVNAGGVLHLAGYERLGWSADEMIARLAGIGGTLERVLEAAVADGVTPQAAAMRLARERVEDARRMHV
jgi:leucine dehydrogenase